MLGLPQHCHMKNSLVTLTVVSLMSPYISTAFATPNKSTFRQKQLYLLSKSRKALKTVEMFPRKKFRLTDEFIFFREWTKCNIFEFRAILCILNAFSKKNYVLCEKIKSSDVFYSNNMILLYYIPISYISHFRRGTSFLLDFRHIAIYKHVCVWGRWQNYVKVLVSLKRETRHFIEIFLGDHFYDY